MLPSAGGTQSLPRTTSIGTALRLVLTGERVDVETARDLGLVDVVADDPDQAAQDMAGHLASLPPQAVAGVRQAVRFALDGPAGRRPHG
jgi:enoyl-CoA hydratase/carnithine racemase